jgi:Fe2+ or Zn2+ uptake regulation protein
VEANASHDLSEPVSLDEVGRRMGTRGVRFTPQRRAVAETVLQSVQPMTAIQIHDAARALRPELGLMTVYRTLELLADSGVVRRVHGDQHCEAFVSTGLEHGHTVVCTNCGRAVEFSHCSIDALAAAAAAETGFTIDRHFLQFSGLCPECRLLQKQSGAADAGAGDDGEGAGIPARPGAETEG